MSKKIIFIIVLCALISRAGSAKEARESVIILPLNTSDINNNMDALLSDTLVENGILLDDKSKIYIHEEKNSISLACFNCISRSIDNKIEMFQSYNEFSAK